VTGLRSTLAVIWRLAVPYFRSEDRWTGRILLGAVIAIELAITGINVLINQWNARFYNALQDRNWDVFVSEMLFFCILAALYVALSVYQVYLRQWLEIRWRRWMTSQYLDHWLDRANHYRMQLLGDAADNPDQRIADDIRLFIERSLVLGVGLLGAIVSFASFVAILWVLSADAPLTLFGTDWTLPGYLVWAAVLYAIVGTALTHLIGWRLVGLNFQQQRFEADFRFNLVRVRENSEQIALLDGEKQEGERLRARFANVVSNWWAIMQRTKKVTFLTNSYGQAAIVFPYIVASPAYFAGKLQLGGLMQIANAFSEVQRALSFFIDAYRTLAEWRAVVDRLAGFNVAIDSARKAAVTPPVVEVIARAGKSEVEIDDLALRLPTGVPLLTADDIRVALGDRVLVTGPSGSGKSTLFRAIAGIWPFGSGTVLVPADARLMTLPQRPYFPIASLAGAVSYPAERAAFSDAQIAEVLGAVGLPDLVGRLAEEAHWNRMLSPGEQQRLGIARALLHAPDYLFLDEATASLDEDSEAALYHLLQDRLKSATIVSIGHRPTLNAFHRRRLTLMRDGNRHRVREIALEPAAG
jgi:vitamin B12/bleomycin/antimicrobial peptide transport system ATP-binding/permease protein